jgi:hypothetical protein
MICGSAFWARSYLSWVIDSYPGTFTRIPHLDRHTATTHSEAPSIRDCAAIFYSCDKAEGKSDSVVVHTTIENGCDWDSIPICT